MIQAVKTKTQLLLEFPDNLQKLITAQDTRDFVVSAFAYPAVVDPSVVNDAFDTGHIGAAFDTGQWWWDSAALKLWFCASGQPAGAAQWKLVYPQSVGVGVTSVSGAQGTRTSTGLPITGVGTIWADQPLVASNVSYSVVLSERGALEVLGPAVIVATWPGIGFEFPSGWFLDDGFLTTSGVITLATSDASPKFTGGGLSWLTSAGGGVAIPSFAALGGDSCRIVSDGTNYRVLGLPIWHGVDVQVSAVQLIASGTTISIPWSSSAIPWLGLYNGPPQQAFTHVAAGNFTSFFAPVIGIYQMHVRLGINSLVPGDFLITILIQGQVARTVRQRIPAGISSTGWVSEVTCIVTCFMDIGWSLIVRGGWQADDSVSPCQVSDIYSNAQWQWLGR